MEEFSVKTPSGIVMKGRKWEAKEPKANLTIITGMDEHATRYAPFAEFLNEHGVNVWCLDALGQGLNAESEEAQERWPKDGFFENVAGIAEMVKLAKSNGLPTTHMGHSMGSFLSQSLIQWHPLIADKVVLCGSNGGQAFLMSAANLISKLIVHKGNWDKENKFMDNLGLGGYSKAIKDRKTDFDWLSYNEENVKKYIDDPYCGHANTGGFWKGFTAGMKTIWKKKYMSKVDKKQKILIVAGQDDPVGQNGKGLKWLENAYKKVGVNDVTLILYPNMRHEILNEIEKEKPYNDILNFIFA
ncbi:MAG: lysophospholipase [Bacilli bacterium]|nr:lysophospholipase [Bacilli bacterium]